MGIFQILESPLDITTSTIIKRIVANHEAYQASFFISLLILLASSFAPLDTKMSHSIIIMPLYRNVMRKRKLVRKNTTSRSRLSPETDRFKSPLVVFLAYISLVLDYIDVFG